MRNAIASQLGRYNFFRFTMVSFQQPLEKTLCSCTVTTGLEKHIDHLAILVNSPPQVLLLTTNLHKYQKGQYQKGQSRLKSDTRLAPLFMELNTSMVSSSMQRTSTTL